MNARIPGRALTLALLIAVPSNAQQPLFVGVEHNPPFVVEEGTGWGGESIDIIEAIAADLDRSVEFVEFDTIDELLTAVETGSVDMSISAITMTAARERRVDFSHPYASTNIAVLVREDASAIGAILRVTERILAAVVLLVLLLYAAGWIIGRLDRNFEDKHVGAWWALVTFSTTGYGDVVPSTRRGRAFASLWILISLFLCSLFTGYISSVMTVERMAGRPMNVGMLSESIVLAVDGSASAAFLDAFGMSFMPLRTLDEALEMFLDGAADAVVGDQVLLEYGAGSGRFSIWPLSQRAQLYGIAMPENSPLVESVNRSILLHTQ